jgi:hypothetical protein
MSRSTIATSIHAASKETVASTKLSPGKLAPGAATVQRPSTPDKPGTKSPVADSGDEFELEPAIEPPKVSHVSEFDDSIQLQPVSAKAKSPMVEGDAENGEVESKPAEKDDASETSTALQFLGICGIVIMGMSALVGLLNVAGAIYMVTRPNVSISASMVVLGIVAFQSVIYFILYRLGQGLLRCERASVQGLVVLYVLGLGAAACGMAAGYFLAGSIVMGALSIFMLPPIIVGFMAWSDLYGEDE